MSKQKPRLRGFGLDGDGHVRVTKAPDYRLHGGTQETHEKMQEIAARTNEALKKQGHTIRSASPERLVGTVNEVVQRIEDQD
jgi:hypothetical protein